MLEISRSWFRASLFVVCTLSHRFIVQCAPTIATSPAARTEGSGAPLAVQSKLQLCLGQEFQSINRKLGNIFVNSRAVQEAIFGTAPNNPIPPIGLYSVRGFKRLQPSEAAVAGSVQYMMCFVEPVADALKNETYRAVVRRDQGTVYSDKFVYVLTNLSVAKDLYELVQQVPLNSGRTPYVTNSTVECPPVTAPMAVSGITAELTYVGAIAYELSNLSDDIRVQLLKVLCSA